MPRSIRVPLISVIAVTAFGCTFQPKEGSGTGTITNPSGTDASAGIDRFYTNQDTSGVTGGDGCGSTSFTANNLPPDILIVLDRSGSMNEDPATGMSMPGSPNSKWAQVTTAINQVVGQTETKIRWGLKFFASGSGNGSCTVSAAADIPAGPMNAGAIAGAIASTTPGSATPTRAAETTAAAALLATTDPNPKYLLLATDGQPNCRPGGGSGGADDAGAVQAVATVAAMGLPTFVVGIATMGGTGDATLSMMAVAGGHPRAANPQYYPVTTSADLVQALGVIQSMATLPCQFQLGGVPSDLTAVSVSVGGQAVSMADWMFGMGNRSIVFPDAGTICTGLKAGTLKDVVIHLPCGAMIIP